jgi:hypothetical protein
MRPPSKLLWTLLAWAGSATAGCTTPNPGFGPADASTDGGTDESTDEPPPRQDSAPAPTDSGPDEVAMAACQSPVAVAGTGINAEYFDNADLTGTRVARIDSTIDWYFPNNSPDPALGADTFSARWTGKLQPAVSGPHTFHATYNDGVRLFLDDRVVMYRWGLHATTDESATVNLVAGRKYDLRMEFFDQTGAAWARLAWETPCQPRQVIPVAHFHPEAPPAPTCLATAAPGSGVGLSSEYFGDRQLSSSRVTGRDARVDFDWGSGAPVTMAGFPVDSFSVRWTGKLQAPITGPLTIHYHADDVGRLWLGGALLLDSWSEPSAAQEVAATVDVVAGQMLDIRIEHQERNGTASARLWWSWPCQSGQVVPTERLYPAAGP